MAVSSALPVVPGLTLSVEEVVRLCEQCDEDGDLELSFCEFAAMMAVSNSVVEKVVIPEPCDLVRLQSLLSIKPIMRSSVICTEIRYILRLVRVFAVS